MPITRVGYIDLRTRTLNHVPPNVFVYTTGTGSLYCDFPTIIFPLCGLKFDGNLNECSLTHVVRNNQELFIYAAPPPPQDAWKDRMTAYLQQLIIIESLLKDIDLGDAVRTKFCLVLGTKGRARLVKQDFIMAPLPHLAGFVRIDERRLQTYQWQPTLIQKWARLDGVREVIVLYAWDYNSSERLFLAICAMQVLRELDLIAPVIGCLVDDEDHMIGLVFENEQGTRPLESGDRGLVITAFQKLEARHLYMWVTPFENQCGYEPSFVVFDPHGVVVANDKIRFANDMLSSWINVWYIPPGAASAGDLEEVRCHHWKIAQSIVDSCGEFDEPDAYPSRLFDLNFYESFTVILPPEFPLEDVVSLFVTKAARSIDRASGERKRRRRIEDAKRKGGEEEDKRNQQAVRLYRNTAFAAWSNISVGLGPKKERNARTHGTSGRVEEAGHAWIEEVSE